MPPFFPGSVSLLDSLPPPLEWGRGQGMGFSVSSSRFVCATPSSSLSSPAPAWHPSHDRQFSTNFSNVSPSHGVQSFRNRLLQCVSAMGSYVLPANLLPSPWLHRSWEDPAPAQAFHGVTSSFGHPPAPTWGPPRAASGCLLHHGPPQVAGKQPASPRSSSQVARQSLL